VVVVVVVVVGGGSGGNEGSNVFTFACLSFYLQN